MRALSEINHHEGHAMSGEARASHTKTIYEKVMQPEVPRDERGSYLARRAIAVVTLGSLAVVAGGAAIDRYFPKAEESMQVTDIDAALVKSDSIFNQRTLVEIDVENDVTLELSKNWGGNLPGIGDIVGAINWEGYETRYTCTTTGKGWIEDTDITTELKPHTVNAGKKNESTEYLPTVTIPEGTTIHFDVYRENMSEDCVDVEGNFLSSLNDSTSSQIDALPFLDSDRAENYRDLVVRTAELAAFRQTSNSCGPVGFEAAKDALIEEIQQQTFDDLERIYAAQGLPIPIDTPSDVVVEVPKLIKSDEIENQYEDDYEKLDDSEDMKITGMNEKVECQDMTAGAGNE
jgi:hypothetical protein